MVMWCRLSLLLGVTVLTACSGDKVPDLHGPLSQTPPAANLIDLDPFGGSSAPPAPPPAPEPAAAAPTPGGQAPPPAPTGPPTPAPDAVIAGILAPKPPASVPMVPNQMTNTVQALLGAMMALINTPNLQWAVATFYLVAGGAALIDGPKFTKYVILGIVVAFGYFLVLLQIGGWHGKMGGWLKFVISLEAGVFLAFAAHRGWKGAQLLIGGVLGLQLYDQVTALALILPYVEIAAKHSLWAVIVTSLCVVLGCVLINDNEKYGFGGTVLGVLAPLVGSTVVVSAFSYLFMLLATNPAVGQAWGVVPPISIDDVPPVSAFWMMVTHPWGSKTVGFFSAAHKNLVINGNEFELDRILSVLFAALLFIGAARYQVQNAKRKAEFKREQLHLPTGAVY